jgi:hypothetical protein
MNSPHGTADRTETREQLLIRMGTVQIKTQMAILTGRHIIPGADLEIAVFQMGSNPIASLVRVTVPVANLIKEGLLINSNSIQGLEERTFEKTQVPFYEYNDRGFIL